MKRREERRKERQKEGEGRKRLGDRKKGGKNCYSFIERFAYMRLKLLLLT